MADATAIAATAAAAAAAAVTAAAAADCLGRKQVHTVLQHLNAKWG